MKPILVTALVACLPWLGTSPLEQEPAPKPAPAPTTQPPSKMKLGAFSVSLAVKDLAASRAFYTKLGFEKHGGNEKQNWLILKNGTTVIGLFQGMFEDNIMTFNPGWDQNADKVDPFTDVRKLQAKFEAEGITPVTPIAPDVLAKKGPASFVIEDPDGNTILFDQHR